MPFPFRLSPVPRRLSFLTRFYLLFGGPRGFCASIFLAVLLVFGLVFYANLNLYDYFFTPEKTSLTARVTETHTMLSKIHGRNVSCVVFTWNDAQNRAQTGICYTLAPPEVGTELTLEHVRNSYRLEGTTFGILGEVPLSECGLVLGVSVLLLFLGFGTAVWNLCLGRRTIHLLRYGTLCEAYEIHRNETGVKINGISEAVISYRYALSSSETSSETSVEGGDVYETSIKTLHGDALSPETAPLLADTCGNAWLLEDLRETLFLRPNGEFALRPRCLLSVLWVVFFIAALLAAPFILMHISK